MTPLTLTKIAEVRAWVRNQRQQRRSIGLVPTMGALHPGHLTLIEKARAGSDAVVVSIFVNPTQFNQPDDYRRYPRPFAADLAACEQAGVHAVFAPAEEEMYPEPILTSVEVARVSEGLCGAYRPGHFRGVATVVLKLLNVVQPDRAWFGEKDAQQLAVISRMVRDLNVPVEIVPVETVREADGLALSSRNVHLTADQRRAAPVLYKALEAAAVSLRSGGDIHTARNAGLEVLAREPAVRVEYFEIVSAADMQPADALSGSARIAAAVWLGNTRLIDNVRVEAVGART